MKAVCIIDFEKHEKSNMRRENEGACEEVPLEFYGVWFAGTLWLSLKDKFGDVLNKRANAFIVPDQNVHGRPVLPDGIHELTTYGEPCRLYKWTAQGYHRGLVVLADDEKANAMALKYYESTTWSWILKDTLSVT